MSGINVLFPIFLKLDTLKILIVGGGNVAIEKIKNIIKNNPRSNIILISPEILTAIKELSVVHPTITLIERNFRIWDLGKGDIIILATELPDTNKRIRGWAHRRGLLVNVADTPELCDFYMGSTVTKGNLKIGISTNGKSPTIARRIREFFEEVLPEDIPQLIENMNSVRAKIKGDFQDKVKALNQITEAWLKNSTKE